ncbi:MAG: PEP-CTERM sorting domain-containing protein [Planctomycetaceae bacterium]|nr:PEP-CTERM sorting domain-containing protein [Planctomycetaceae bacterium]
MKHVFAFAGAVLVLAGATVAAPITINNPGFESGSTGWTVWGSGWTAQPTDAEFPGASSGSLPAPAGGTTTMVGGSTFGGRIWQKVDGVTVQADMIYTLTVATGRPANLPFDLTQWDIYLSAGNDANSTRLGTQWITPSSVPAGTFVDTTLVVDTTGLDPSLIGKNLIVVLHDNDGLNGYPSAGYHFDNVRLNISPIPEPATMSLLALGSLAALMKRRRNN